MISTSDLQALIEKVEGGSQGVDLVKIGQNYAQQGEYWKWKKKSSCVLFVLKMDNVEINVCILQCQRDHCVDFVLLWILRDVLIDSMVAIILVRSNYYFHMSVCV